MLSLNLFNESLLGDCHLLDRFLCLLLDFAKFLLVARLRFFYCFLSFDKTSSRFFQLLFLLFLKIPLSRLVLNNQLLLMCLLLPGNKLLKVLILCLQSPDPLLVLADPLLHLCASLLYLLIQHFLVLFLKFPDFLPVPLFRLFQLRVRLLLRCPLLSLEATERV
jgi:hypothetical protein